MTSPAYTKSEWSWSATRGSQRVADRLIVAGAVPTPPTGGVGPGGRLVVPTGPAGSLSPGPLCVAGKTMDETDERDDGMSKPLEGIKVVEVSMWAYVPSAGAVLADWGADVVKIESPVGDPSGVWSMPALAPWMASPSPGRSSTGEKKASPWI